MKSGRRVQSQDAVDGVEEPLKVYLGHAVLRLLERHGTAVLVERVYETVQQCLRAPERHAS